MYWQLASSPTAWQTLEAPILATSLGLELPMTELAAACFRWAAGDGFDQLDQSAVFKLLNLPPPDKATTVYEPRPIRRVTPPTGCSIRSFLNLESTCRLTRYADRSPQA
jgi:hypothetical protein